MATATLIEVNSAPMAASTAGRLVTNSRKPNGLWEVYVDGVATLPPHDGHRGGTDITADSRYVLMHTARGAMRSSEYAEPGKGLNNDIELLDRQTNTVRVLVTGRQGTIWAKLSPDATKLCWADMKSGTDFWHHLLGTWTLHVADITPTGIANERSWEHPTDPNGFIETYGWVPGTNKIIFASDSGSRNSFMYWLGSQLWTIPDTLPAIAPTRVSQPFGSESPYHEFAHFHDGWLYTSIVKDAVDGGMDLWRMKYDGSSRERVTYFGGKSQWSWNSWSNEWKQQPGFPPPMYVVVGSMAWVNGGWDASVALSRNAEAIDSYKITL